MDDLKKRVSIIIPCYNKGKYVEEAIESAINQTYDNIEIVCVNDGSTDSSSVVIKKLADKYSNLLFFDNAENRGVVYARNMAIEASSGEYILPLDADDKIAPTYIEKAVNVLESDESIGMVYCEAEYFGIKHGKWELPEYNKEQFLFRNCIFCSALFRKSDFLRAGKYKDYMRTGFEDWDLWLSFIELGLKPYRINEVLFSYRTTLGQSRTNISKDTTDDWLKEIVKHHIDLYVNNPKFVANVAKDNDVVYKKYKKYKGIFNKVFIPITVFETLIILVFVVMLCVK